MTDYRDLYAAKCKSAEALAAEIQDGWALCTDAALAELDLSARAYDRVLKVARTIADLAGAEAVDEEHVFEASQYRALDRSYWT